MLYISRPVIVPGWSDTYQGPSGGSAAELSTPAAESAELPDANASWPFCSAVCGEACD